MAMKTQTHHNLKNKSAYDLRASSDTSIRLAYLKHMPKQAAQTYVMSIDSDGSAKVNSFQDEVLFGMILSKVMGVQVDSFTNRFGLIDGRKMSWEDALERAVKQEPSMFKRLSDGSYSVHVDVSFKFKKVK